MPSDKTQITGFQVWLRQKANDARQMLCWFVGHKFTTSKWYLSPNTVATHWREITCQRCGIHYKENGFFDARNSDAWPGEERA